MQCIEKDSQKIGGEGIVVELDESKFVKRKYQRGRRVVCKEWVFGGVERGTGRCFMRIVEKRDARTLLRLIQDNVHKKSIIVTDSWKAYRDIKKLIDEEGNLEFLEHYQVNHSKHFVDPVTGQHTNTIEETWAHANIRCHVLAYTRAF